MSLSKEELELLKVNSLSVSNAKSVAEQIENDYTAGGIFPKGSEEDFSNPNMDKFKSKWCSWWKVAKILLTIAKIFTGDKGDKVIDALLSLGNENCN